MIHHNKLSKLAERLGVCQPHRNLHNGETVIKGDSSMQITALDLFNPIQESLLMGHEVNRLDACDSPPLTQRIRGDSERDESGNPPGSPRSVATLKCIDFDAANKNLLRPSAAKRQQILRATPTTRGVRFDCDAQVYEVPSHRDYPKDLKDLLWMDAQQWAKSVERNTLEFLADGWDWRKAAEEDSMVQVAAGEFVHPATWMRFAPIRPASERRRKTSKYIKSAVIQARNLAARENAEHKPVTKSSDC